MKDSETGTSYGVMAEAALSSGFSVVSASIGLLMLFGASHDLGVRPEPHHLAAVTVMIGFGLALIAIGVLHARRWIPRSLVSWAPATVALICCTNSGVDVLLTGDALGFMYMYLALVVTAATVPRVWMLLAADAAAIGTFVFAVPTPVNEPWTHLVGGLIMTVVVGLFLYFHLDRGRRQLRLLTELIGHEASHDQLTGLLNRRGLRSATLALIDDHVTPAPLGALWLDVDGFKAVNDELGHSTGDAVLCEIAVLLAGLTRPSDVLARVGGDEFVVVVAIDDVALLNRMAARMQTQLRGRAGVLEVPWSVSIGVALRTVSDDFEADLLLRAADVAMYDDKRWRGTQHAAIGGSA